MSVNPDYSVVSQVHINQWVSSLNRAVPGWEITVRDNTTGTIVPVFVDDDHYGPEQARTLIEAALAPVRQIASLGLTPPPTSGAKG